MDRVTVGLDLGDRHSRYCAIDEAGKIIEEGRVRSEEDALRACFGSGAARVVLEVGTHSPWVSRLLKELGHEVIVANPRRLRFIWGESCKNDRKDAEQLARVGRMDPELLQPIQHRGKEAQMDLAVLRSRDMLVRTQRSPLPSLLLQQEETASAGDGDADRVRARLQVTDEELLVVFGEINGVDALSEPDDLEEATLAVAASEMSKDALTDWMRSRVGRD